MKKTEHIKQFKKWKAVDGDNTLRLNYPLNENSIVLDIGGYLGDFTDNLYKKYNCNIYVFEPVESYYSKLCDRFKNNSKIQVFNYAIADESKSFDIIIKEDATHLISTPGKINNSIKSFKEVYDYLNLTTIDLLKLNVEGSEYDILNNIFKHNLTKHIQNIQVQFHYPFINSDYLLQIARENLSKTHRQTWNYEWIWENWELNNV